MSLGSFRHAAFFLLLWRLFALDNAFVVVELWPDEIPISTKVAIQTCVGLSNRNSSHAPAYALLSPLPRGNETAKVTSSFGTSPDQSWIDALGLSPSASYTAESYLRQCLRTHRRRVRYDYISQRAVLPNIITLGAVLDAIPLDIHYRDVDNAEVVFDAINTFAHNSPLEATTYVYENHVDSTTAMVKLNPGFDKGMPYPTITGDIKPHLIDFVVMERLFAFFLPHGCVPLTSERELVQRMATNNPWPRPVPVYGYDTSLVVEGGDVFEAETMCVPARNLGAIASAEASNLSFFARRSKKKLDLIDSGIVQNPPAGQVYDSSKVYVAFIVGDGDNIGYMKGTRADWMRIRFDACAMSNGDDAARCAPLTWTVSPHLLYLAPEILSWYVDMSRTTGRDYFLLPPSGHLYSYPASTPPDVQRTIVEATEQDAKALNTTGLVDWEWFTAWRAAEEQYYPRYCRNGRIRGIFPLSVPYFSPTFRFADNEYNKVLYPPTGEVGSPVVMFRPREWRDKSPDEMAKEVGSYPPGTVAYVYMTSDGGLNMARFQEMSKLVPSNVELVGTEDAAALALRASGLRVGEYIQQVQ